MRWWLMRRCLPILLMSWSSSCRERSLLPTTPALTMASYVPAELFAGLPHGPGGYRFYGDNDVLLYVGKSTNIAHRVASHFSGDHHCTRGLRLSESLRRVELSETTGELPAVAQPAVLMP